MADDVRLEIVAVDKTRAAVDSAKRNMQGLEKAAQSANATFAQVGRTAAGVFGGMAAFAAASGVSNALMGIGKTAFDAYAQSERLRQSLQAMSAKEIMQAGGANNMAQALQMAGSRAKELQGWIERMAVQSPFGQEDVAAALRMGMAYGFNSREAQRLTQIMLDYSAATGQSGETMQRVALALGQIRARGKLAGQEINQLTEAGINVRQILADAFGKTTAEITSMSEKGLIGAKEAIDAITNALETDFKGAAAASATSMAGLVATFQDISQLRLRDLFAGAFEAAQPYIIDIADALSSPKFTLAVTTLGAALGGFTTTKLGEAAGYIQQISDAMNSAPKDTPGWMVAIAGLTPGQFDSVLGTLETIKATMTELGEGDFETAWTIVANEQDPEVKEWMLWFRDESKRTVEAVVNFSATTTEKADEWFTWLQDEAKREVTIAAKMADDAGTSLTAWWEQWKKDNEAANATWQPTITALAKWGEGLWPGLRDEAQKEMDKPLEAKADWENTQLGKLFDAVKLTFAIPIMIMGDWASTALTTLLDSIQAFFSANPIGLNFSTPTPEVGSQYSGHSNFPRRPSPVGGQTGQSWPADITMPPPQANEIIDPRYWTQNRPPGTSGEAVGSGFFAGGLALVGEVGPELVSLPRGTQILRNADTRKVLGNVPAFQEGNTPLGGALNSMVDSLLNLMGVQYRAPAGTPNNMYGVEGAKAVEKAYGKAAQNTEDAFANAASATQKKFAESLEGALGKIPGLFGTSQVTKEQMAMAAAGMPQRFPDSWLRELRDEVQNGVDRPNVDIKEAALSAGIDPNLPNEIILQLVEQAWADGSFFANPANLAKIDTSAVQEFIAKQQAQELGKANVLAYFGDPDIANNALGSMAGAIGSAATSPENVEALKSAGYTGAAVYYQGWAQYMSGATIVPPGAAPTGTGVPVPPAKAVGIGYWAGGAMRVHRDETIFLPHGAGVTTAAESRRAAMGGGGGSVTINAQVSSNIDVEALTSQVARRLRARMN